MHPFASIYLATSLESYYIYNTITKMVKFLKSLLGRFKSAPSEYRPIKEKPSCNLKEHHLWCGHVVILKEDHPCGSSCIAPPSPKEIDDLVASYSFKERHLAEDYRFIEEPFDDEENILCHICIRHRYEESFYYLLFEADLVSGPGFVWLVDTSGLHFPVPCLQSETIAVFRYRGGTDIEKGGETLMEIWQEYRDKGRTYLGDIERRILRDGHRIAKGYAERDLAAVGLQRDVGQGRAAREQADKERLRRTNEEIQRYDPSLGVRTVRVKQSSKSVRRKPSRSPAR